MLQGIPIPGRTRPTARQVYRAEVGKKLDWLPPPRETRRGHPGTIFCPRCHAISTGSRWFQDESLYQSLRATPEAHPVICPGCRGLEAQTYQGAIFLQSPLLQFNREQALDLISNAEARAREHNPTSRILTIEGRGDTLIVYVTTTALAERIGRAFHHSFKGTLRLQWAPGEHFIRVFWTRA